MKKRIILIVFILIILVITFLFLKNTNTNKELSQKTSNNLEKQQQDIIKEQEKTENEQESPDKHENEQKTLPTNTFIQQYRDSPEIPSETERAKLPDCATILYTFPYVEPSNIREITPLGNVDPPGHTIPTNHVYTHLTLPRESTQTLPLYLPADVWLAHISINHGFTQDPEDDTIYFAVCKDVIGYFNHVKKLSPEMQKIVDNYKCSADNNKNNCMIQVLIPLKKGTYLGEVGRLQGNFDFGTIDLRTEHNFVNEERYAERTLHIQCPFDYYAPELKNKYYSLLQGDSKSCGKTNYDIPETLQGNWFYGDSREYYGGDWVKHAFFGYDNVKPERAVLSFGGVIVPENGLRWKFIPVNSGTINRKFEDVKADETIYCYDANNQDQFNKSPSGRILVKMENDKQIKVEYQNGGCSGNLIFTNNAKIYER